MLLLTGPPGCGKTTLLQTIAAEFGEHAAPLLYGGLAISGFHTEEVRDTAAVDDWEAAAAAMVAPQRIGFDVVSYADGSRAPLARRAADGSKGGMRVGVPSPGTRHCPSHRIVQIVISNSHIK
eukprot:SAG11_NODE_1564_length_4675_cov_2.781687_8_plen_123_part_00